MTQAAGNEVLIRPAAVGDLCVLLEPGEAGEIERLRQQQRLLQASFGGTFIERFHLTCQRFVNEDEQQLKDFQETLSSRVAGIAPFSLRALSLQTLYLPIRQTNILKWQIEVSDELRQFVAVVERAVMAAGMQPLYRRGFVSSLLAALKEVSELDEASLAKYGGFPHHLYTGERIVVSQIGGPDEFKTIAIIPLNSGGESAD